MTWLIKQIFIVLLISIAFVPNISLAGKVSKGFADWKRISEIKNSEDRNMEQLEFFVGHISSRSSYEFLLSALLLTFNEPTDLIFFEQIVQNKHVILPNRLNGFRIMNVLGVLIRFALQFQSEVRMDLLRELLDKEDEELLNFWSKNQSFSTLLTLVGQFVEEKIDSIRTIDGFYKLDQVKTDISAIFSNSYPKAHLPMAAESLYDTLKEAMALAQSQGEYYEILIELLTEDSPKSRSFLEGLSNTRQSFIEVSEPVIRQFDLVEFTVEQSYWRIYRNVFSMAATILKDNPSLSAEAKNEFVFQLLGDLGRSAVLNYSELDIRIRMVNAQKQPSHEKELELKKQHKYSEIDYFLRDSNAGDERNHILFMTPTLTNAISTEFSSDKFVQVALDAWKMSVEIYRKFASLYTGIDKIQEEKELLIGTGTKIIDQLFKVADYESLSRQKGDIRLLEGLVERRIKKIQKLEDTLPDQLLKPLKEKIKSSLPSIQQKDKKEKSSAPSAWKIPRSLVKGDALLLVLDKGAAKLFRVIQGLENSIVTQEDLNALITQLGGIVLSCQANGTPSHYKIPKHFDDGEGNIIRDEKEGSVSRIEAVRDKSGNLNLDAVQPFLIRALKGAGIEMSGG